MHDHAAIPPLPDTLPARSGAPSPAEMLETLAVVHHPSLYGPRLIVAEAVAAAFVAPLMAAELGHDGFDLGDGPAITTLRMLEEMVGEDSSTTALEFVLAIALAIPALDTADDVLEREAQLLAAGMRDRGATDPPWSDSPRGYQLVDCWVHRDCWHARTDVYTGWRSASGEEHVLGVLGSPDASGAIGDVQIIVEPMEVVAATLKEVFATPCGAFVAEPVMPAHAGGLIARMLDATERCGAGLLEARGGLGALPIVDARFGQLAPLAASHPDEWFPTQQPATVLDAMTHEQLLEAFTASGELAAERQEGASDAAAALVVEWAVHGLPAPRARFSLAQLDELIAALEGVAADIDDNEVIDERCRELRATIRAWARFTGSAAGIPASGVAAVITDVDCHPHRLRRSIVRRLCNS